MPSLKWRLDKLTDAPSDARSDLLLAALAQCEPDETELIAKAALTSRTPESVAAVIRLLDRHPGLYDDLLSMDRQTVAAGMQLVFFRGSQRARLSAIELAERWNDPRVSMELLVPLRSGDEPIRAAAASALLKTTIALVGRNGRRHLSKARLNALDKLICGALDSYETHRSLEIITAAAMLHGRLHTKLRELLATPGTPQRLAVQGIPRRTSDPLIRGNLIHWLKSDVLGRQAAQFLDTLTDPFEFADAIAGETAGAHLLLAPARRKMLAHANRAARYLPDLTEAVKLSEPAQHWLPRYVNALPIPENKQVAYLSDLIALPSPTARWRAAEIIMGHRIDAAHDATRYFARDSEPAVAIAPAMQLFHETNALSINELRSLSRCRHSKMATRAKIELASKNAEHWAEFAMELPRSAMIMTARKLCASQRKSFVSQVIHLLEAPQRDYCLCGIAIARRLQLTRDVEGPLLALLQSDDAQRCSAAASALADYGPRRLEILTQLLQHDHARVRANAVEALATVVHQLKPKHGAKTVIEVIAPRSESRNNRERANALAAWIRHGGRRHQQRGPNSPVLIDIIPAIDKLQNMLRDSDPMHRVSAIWAAGRSQRLELASSLEAIAKVETLEPIRVRAVGALRRLVPVAA